MNEFEWLDLDGIKQSDYWEMEELLQQEGYVTLNDWEDTYQYIKGLKEVDYNV